MPAIFPFPNANKHAGAALHQGVRGNARPFQRLPTHLQQQPVLGIHPHRLTRRNPKKAWVELIYLLEERTFLRVDLPRQRALRVVVGRHRPARRWYLLHLIRSRLQQPPERLRCRRPWKAARHAHHRQRRMQRGCGQGRRFVRHDLRPQRQHVVPQIVREGHHGRVFKGHCRGQRCAHQPLQAPAQLQRHQRVHAQIGQPGGGRGWFAHPKDAGHHLGDLRAEPFVPLRRQQCGQRSPQSRRSIRRCHGGRHHFGEHRGNRPRLCPQPRPVGINHRQHAALAKYLPQRPKP